MTTQTLKIKNGAIALPSVLLKKWQESDVLVFPSEDTLLIKRIQNPLKKLSDLAGRISVKPFANKSIAQEIKNYRKLQ